MCRAPPKITRSDDGYHLNFLRFFKATAQDGSDLLGPKVHSGMGCGMWCPPIDSKTFQVVWLKVERLMWMFPKIVVPQIINFHRVFHYKPSILGYPHFWKHPCRHWRKLWIWNDQRSRWFANRQFLSKVLDVLLTWKQPPRPKLLQEFC